MLEIKLSNYAVKFLKKCESNLSERIITRIKNLSKDPFPIDAKRIMGEKKKIFRVRVGDYRILYIVFNNLDLLFISDIDKRAKIYKRG